MTVCQSWCQVVSLDCSQSVTGKKQHPIFILLWIKTGTVPLVPSGTQKIDLVELYQILEKNMIWYTSCYFYGNMSPFKWCIRWQHEHQFVCIFCLWYSKEMGLQWTFPVSSLRFCCSGVPVQNFMRLMILSRTCEAFLTKMQQHNVQSNFFFPRSKVFPISI